MNDKSDLLRNTADEFDLLMGKFNESKQRLAEALDEAGFKNEKIDEYLKSFDEGKAVIAELLPIRDNVREIQETILKPVANVIADNSGTNKRFGLAGIAMAAIGVSASLLAPYVPFLRGPEAASKALEAKVDDLRTALKPMIDEKSSAARAVLYDTFDSADMSLYDAPRLSDVGSVGATLGYESAGFQPKTQLVYKPVAVPCEKGCVWPSRQWSE